MNKFVTFLLLFSLPSVVLAGFILTEENDVVWKKDNNYTQGIELKMANPAFEDNDSIFVFSLSLVMNMSDVLFKM